MGNRSSGGTSIVGSGGSGGSVGTGMFRPGINGGGAVAGGGGGGTTRAVVGSSTGGTVVVVVGAGAGATAGAGCGVGDGVVTITSVCRISDSSSPARVFWAPSAKPIMATTPRAVPASPAPLICRLDTCGS